MSGFRKALTTVCAVLGACGLSAVMPAAASAAIECAYDEGADQVILTATANDDLALFGTSPGGEIAAFDLVANAPVVCTGAGGPPTVANTTDISVTDAAVSSAWSVIDPELLVHSGTGSEIDMVVALGNEFDRFSVFDGNVNASNDFWTVGDAGINWNGDTDSDISFLTAVDELTMSGSDGNDAFTGQGQQGTGDPFAGPGRLILHGGRDDDDLWGGDARDRLVGDINDDTLLGFAGNDDLNAGPGTNELDGGDGSDIAEFDEVTGPVTADLAAGTATKAGDGTDTLAGIEGMIGSPEGDTLRGDDMPNSLAGADGDDTLVGRGLTDSLFGGINSSAPGTDGNDTIDGGAGTDSILGEEGVDTVTFANAPAGVEVDLGAGTATGDGTDAIGEVENLIGSPFADTLTGSPLANSIIGLGGGDTVSALAGPDAVDVRDGGRDTASCGAEVDSATADRASLDTVNADCENVAFLPEPPGNGEPPGNNEPPPGGEDRELSFELSGKRRQRVLKRKAVVVRASCPLEDCEATARGGKLKPREEELAASDVERIKLKLRRKKLRAVANALNAGRKPKVKVRAEATDAAGNATTKSLTVRARH